MKDASVSSVEGYAADGFPITGSKVAEGKYLLSKNLDECHGLTSTIVIDGQNVTTYHYVMTADFPYSISCFRGKVATQTSSTKGLSPTNNPAPSQAGTPNGNPPQIAIDACSKKISGDLCNFTGMRGENLSGSCGIPPNATQLVCMPN
jgi:hypothetical protein